MKGVNLDNLISMTELQKLSLRKLRKRKTPLFVMDFKSKRGGFVVMSMEHYEKAGGAGDLFGAGPSAARSTKRVNPIPDYRAMGLLWERPGLSNKKFHELLHDARQKENAWALQRLLEYAPSRLATSVLSLQELKAAIARIRLKPFYREAWTHAVHYWSENP